MIVAMSKVELAGPKDLLERTLTLLRQLGIFQIEPDAVGFIEKDEERFIRSRALDEKEAMERAALEELRVRIDELLACLPGINTRESYIDPEMIVDTLSRTVNRHAAYARERTETREALRKELAELQHYGVFLAAMASLMDNAKEAPDLDFIGLTIREPEMAGKLQDALSRITDWKYDFRTETAEDGALVGLVTVEKSVSERVKKTLVDEQVPELTFPASFGGLTFKEKTAYIRKSESEVAVRIGLIEEELERFARRWLPLYRSVRDWIEERLSLLKAAAYAFETRMCFFIHGWMPSRELPALRERLAEAFGTNVVIGEKELLEEDFERVPIVLRNPAYFRHFELLTGLLPLPAYTSYDPTPFIGIFFPVFFGIILGDAGYGLTLVAAALIVRKKFKDRTAVRSAGTILLIGALYAAFFGVLFGEFFGDLPERFFHLEPCIERRTAIVPMLLFAIAIGVAHVLLGLLLGAVNAFRRKIRREGLYKLVSIAVIICMIAVIGALFGFFPQVLTRPMVLLILFLTPLLFFSGGVLAPLEFLKSVGNIISYVRITAIGLTSALLAFVANNLGGLTGDVVTGVAVAGLLHLLNIILGVFSPTIHSLRLHYVEFFSKFIEHGGRKFEPLKK